MNTSLLSTRLVVLLAALAVFLFSLSLILSARAGPAFRSDFKAGPGVYSISSLGYAALYDLLRNLGWRVRGGDAPDDLRDGGALVLAEPGETRSRRTAEKFRRLPDRTLVVLPKWKAVGDPRRSKWIMGIESLPLSDVASVLAKVDPGAKVNRAAWPSRWEHDEWGFAPAGSGMVQLVASDAMKPLVGTASGMLVGELRLSGKMVWVLSDPDVMANHGIGSGDNAALMLALFTRIAGGADGAPILFDEGVHGYKLHRSSPQRLLFEFPYVVVTVLGFLSALLLALAGASRFGRPERAAVGLGFGKESLIDSTARLMEHAGHESSALRRYVELQLRLVGDALHAPAASGAAALAEWLDRTAGKHVSGPSCVDILRSARGHGGYADLMRCAADMRRWREEALSAGSPGGDGIAAAGRKKRWPARR